MGEELPASGLQITFGGHPSDGMGCKDQGSQKSSERGISRTGGKEAGAQRNTHKADLPGWGYLGRCSRLKMVCGAQGEREREDGVTRIL